MKALRGGPISLVITIALSLQASGATEYVLGTLNGSKSNHINIYKLDSSTASLARIASWDTGGYGLVNSLSADVSNNQQAITKDAGCIFVLDAGSSDIAAFSKTNSYARVGNYFDSSLNSTYDGGSIALTPDGKFLYASYSATGNIGQWSVNPDCSLSFVGAYVPLGGIENAAPLSALRVTPDGAGLVVVVPAAQPGAELFAIDQTDGNLSDLGFLSLQSACSVGCTLSGVDITRDSKVAVFAANQFDDGALFAGAFSAEITGNGLINLRAWPLSDQVQINSVPFLSAAAYAGSGNLFFGAQGAGTVPGIITTSFKEKPVRIKASYVNVFPGPNAVGAIGEAADLMVVAQCAQSGDPSPSAIAIFSINRDGSLTPLSTTPISNPNDDLFSVTLFPNMR